MVTVFSRAVLRGRIRSGISREIQDQVKTPGKNPLAVLACVSAIAGRTRPHGDGKAAGMAAFVRHSPPHGSAVRERMEGNSP